MGEKLNTAANSSTHTVERRDNLWKKSARKFFRDKAGLIALSIVLVYFLIALLVWGGLIADQWDELLAEGHSSPSWEYWFGTNINGQDIFQRTIFSTKTAFEVGMVVAIMSTIVGGIAGAIAGFFSGTWIDEVVLWVYSTIECLSLIHI